MYAFHLQWQWHLQLQLHYRPAQIIIMHNKNPLSGTASGARCRHKSDVSIFHIRLFLLNFAIFATKRITALPRPVLTFKPPFSPSAHGQSDSLSNCLPVYLLVGWSVRLLACHFMCSCVREYMTFMWRHINRHTHTRTHGHSALFMNFSHGSPSWQQPLPQLCALQLNMKICQLFCATCDNC